MWEIIAKSVFIPEFLGEPVEAWDLLWEIAVAEVDGQKWLQNTLNTFSNL